VKLGQLIELRPRASLDALSDEALAAACATNDPVAQSVLYERHVDAVHRFVERMHHAPPDVIDDLIQQTFLAAFRSAGSFRGAKLQSWLFGIACNVMRTNVRKEIARRRVTSELAELPPAEPARPQDADVVRLRAAIARLPEKYRVVIVLVDLEGERGADAARILGIPEGTLWRRLSEARSALRAELGERP
jgi:RNA polymerase sigma-70 factor (ECF subfamily)